MFRQIINHLRPCLCSDSCPHGSVSPALNRDSHPLYRCSFPLLPLLFVPRSVAAFDVLEPRLRSVAAFDVLEPRLRSVAAFDVLEPRLRSVAAFDVLEPGLRSVAAFDVLEPRLRSVAVLDVSGRRFGDGMCLSCLEVPPPPPKKKRVCLRLESPTRLLCGLTLPASPSCGRGETLPATSPGGRPRCAACAWRG